MTRTQWRNIFIYNGIKLAIYWVISTAIRNYAETQIDKEEG